MRACIGRLEWTRQRAAVDDHVNWISSAFSSCKRSGIVVDDGGTGGSGICSPNGYVQVVGLSIEYLWKLGPARDNCAFVRSSSVNVTENGERHLKMSGPHVEQLHNFPEGKFPTFRRLTMIFPVTRESRFYGDCCICLWKMYRRALDFRVGR